MWVPPQIPYWQTATMQNTANVVWQDTTSNATYCSVASVLDTS